MLDDELARAFQQTLARQSLAFLPGQSLAPFCDLHAIKIAVDI
jgi:hypothetical protein